MRAGQAWEAEEWVRTEGGDTAQEWVRTGAWVAWVPEVE